MKHLLKIIFMSCIAIIVPLVGLFSLTGCELVVIDYDINDGFDEEEYFPPDYEFKVTADFDNVTIKVSNVGNYGENGHLVALPSYQYLSSETTVGVSREIGVVPIEIGEYACATREEFTIDRYFEDETDAIYYKFYVLDDRDEILAGPMYCTEITPINPQDDPMDKYVKNKKGVMCEDSYRTEVADLGCSYTELNFTITGIVVPNEIYDSKTNTIIPLEYEESYNSAGNLLIKLKGSNDSPISVHSYTYNGKKYYFRRNQGYGFYTLDYYDSTIKKYTDNGVKMTLIMLLHSLNASAYRDKLQYIQPYFMTYEGLQESMANTPNRLMQLNTSNSYGAGYWGALMEFLAERYSREDKKYGLVQTYVMGNEIDMATFWNSIVQKGQPALTLENYCEEYERQMRIGNQAIKKFYSYGKVLISLTHSWQDSTEYAPKEICDYLSIKTLEQGNYDWGYALHPYGHSLPRPDFWQGDTQTSTKMNGSLNTSEITWSNLEVIQLYLEQPTKLYNGKVRSVYLTEGGVSSSAPGNQSTYNTTLEQQAAGVAYAYYKASQLSCVEAIIYYRLYDANEGAYFGLKNSLGAKPAYYVFKYIDTQHSYDVANEYLHLIEWSSYENGSYVTHSWDAGNVTHYKDTMALFKSNFDWDKCNWDIEHIAVRIVDEEIPEI